MQQVQDSRPAISRAACPLAPACAAQHHGHNMSWVDGSHAACDSVSIASARASHVSGAPPAALCIRQVTAAQGHILQASLFFSQLSAPNLLSKPLLHACWQCRARLLCCTRPGALHLPTVCTGIVLVSALPEAPLWCSACPTCHSRQRSTHQGEALAEGQLPAPAGASAPAAPAAAEGARACAQQGAGHVVPRACHASQLGISSVQRTPAEADQHHTAPCRLMDTCGRGAEVRASSTGGPCCERQLRAEHLPASCAWSSTTRGQAHSGAETAVLQAPQGWPGTHGLGLTVPAHDKHHARLLLAAMLAWP